MSKDAILALVAGLLGGSMFLSWFGAGPLGLLVTLVSGLPLFLVGLGLGLRMALLASFAGLALLAAVNATAAGAFLVFDVVPAMIVTGQALRNGRGAGGAATAFVPAGNVVAALTLAAVLALVLGVGQLPDHPDGAEGVIREVIGAELKRAAPTLDADLREGIIAHYAPLLPGRGMVWWTGRALLLAVLAQWLLARTGRNRRPTPDYGALTVPVWLVAAFMVSLGFGVAATGDSAYIARNAALMLSLPLFLQGLVAARAVAAETPMPATAMMGFYGLCAVGLLLSDWPYVGVVVLGFVDHAAGVAQAFGRPRSGKEE